MLNESVFFGVDASDAMYALKIHKKKLWERGKEIEKEERSGRERVRKGYISIEKKNR